ncbi:MAG: Calx-beta domain-containing protein [Verrucomicrobiota bacterium]
MRDNDTGVHFEFSSYTVAEDAAFVLIGIVRGDDGDFPLTVDYATSDVTAAAGQDYRETQGTLTFGAAENLQLFRVPILNDGLKEANKTFRLTLSNPTSGGVLVAPKTAMVTIVNNDPGVQFEFDRYWVQETDGSVTVKVFRGNDQALSPFTVDYSTADGTAVASQHYTETRGTLVFDQGEAAKTLSVPILNRNEAESDKPFRLILSNPSAVVVLGTNQIARITILEMTGMEEHRFDGIAMLPNQSIRLTLAGGVHKRFKDYFDLYPIEVSSNLVDWQPLVTLERTNSSTNSLTYTDPEAGKSDRRFYRTVTNHLITPFPRPPGPFPVGVTSRLVTDPALRNRYGVSTNGSFMVSIWYPAASQVGQLPAPLEDPPLMRDPAWAAEWGANRLMDREPFFMSHALPNVLCATPTAPYPIVVYSPSLTGVRTEVEDMGPYLASCGYLVVSMDHFDAYGTVLPDGMYLRSGVTSSSSSGTLDRVKDVQFILGELPRWNDSDPLLAGRFDLTNVATMGYSWGGEVAGEIGRIDARCKATILIDDPFAFTPELMKSGLQKPCLLMSGAFSSAADALYSKLGRDALSIQFNTTDHNLFCDQYWLYAHNSLNTGREVVRTLHAYSLWFLNKYFKSINEPPPPSKDYPLIRSLKQK